MIYTSIRTTPEEETYISMNSKDFLIPEYKNMRKGIERSSIFRKKLNSCIQCVSKNSKY